MNLILLISIILLSGLLCGRLVKFIKLPNVTGYLLAGLLLGPFVLNVLSKEALEGMTSVSEMALAFIAFTVGLTFKRSYFAKVGFAPFVIAMCEALVAVFLVTGVLLAFGFEPAFAIVLGAIAAATAPAATIMIIKQYGARGPVTEMLMSVVAIDDAVALVAFGFAVSIAKTILGSASNMLLSVAKPFIEVGISLGIGSVIGFLMVIPMKYFKKNGNRMIILIATVFLTSALTSLAGGSALLACMMQGAVLCNISADSDRMGDLSDYITPPLFLMFFVLSGAELDISVLPTIGAVGVIYVITRAAGKYLGAYIGARLMKTTDTVRKYLGPALLPQAGVAIGLSLVATQVVPEHGAQIRAVILCGTLLYEMVGPAVTKLCLMRAGEIKL